MKSLRIALCQLAVTSNKTQNLIAADVAVTMAAQDAATLVVLPECWNSPYGTCFFREYAEEIPGGASTQKLIELAKRHRIYLVGGSIPERGPEVEGVSKLFNTSVVVNPTGEIVAKHRKVTMIIRFVLLLFDALSGTPL
jgi:omega-amidase